MRNHYVHLLQRVCLVLLWAGLTSQTTRAQSVPDAQWARLGTTLAITTDGNIASDNGGIVVKYGLNGDKLLQSGLLAGSSYIGGKISGCPSCVPNVNGYSVVNHIRFLAPAVDGGVLLVGNEFGTGFNVLASLYANFSTAFSGGAVGNYMIGTPDRGNLTVANIPEYSNVTYTNTGRRVVTVSRRSPQLSWTKTISFPPINPTTPDVSLTKANVVINTPDGGFLVAGDFSSTGNSNPEAGWAAKLDRQGNVLWQHLFNSLPFANCLSCPLPNAIRQMVSVTDVVPAVDGNGYALVGIGNLPTKFTTLKPAIMELNENGSFKRAASIDGPTTKSYVTVYTSRNGKKYYAVGNTSLQNGTDPQISLVNPEPLPLDNPNLFKVEARRTFDGPNDGSLVAIGVAGDGGLVFASSGNQVVKLVPEKLNLYEPTYDCASGAITLNTLGGDGSPITYSTPGISRASATSNTGTVEPGLRNDPKDILITATQNGVVTTYTFDLRATCGPQVPKPPLYYPISDLTFVAGQEIFFDFGSYFLDPTGNVPAYSSDWLFTLEGLPEGLAIQSRVPYFRVPNVPILGTPTRAGVYRVNVVASTSGFRSSPIRTSFQITIVPNGQPPVVDPPQPPQPPVIDPPQPPQPPVGPLTLTQPTYNCQTGAITFNTSGGDGSPITYSAPGISRSSATSNSGTVEPGLRGDPKPIPITATQNGQSASFVFDFGAFCNGTQPPQPPVIDPPQPPQPPVGPLTLLAPSYDCASGAIVFRTSGGNSSPVEYMAAGITGWTTNPNQFVDRDSRTANDVKPFTLMARQGGVVVSYAWDLKAACGRARSGVGESTAELRVSVLGNPVYGESALVDIKGVGGQAVQLNLVDLQGRVLHQQRIHPAGSTERVSVPMGNGSGLLLLNVSTATQRQQVKLVRAE